MAESTGPAESVKIYVEHPGGRFETHVLDGRADLGRGEGNYLVLDHPDVSRQHATIYLSGDICFVEDLGSSNGTYVDGELVDEPTQIDTRSSIEAGPYRLYIDGPVSPRPRSDAGTPALFAVSGKLWGRSLALGKVEAVVGRSEEAHFSLPSPSVSRFHVRLYWHQGSYFAEDLDSATGTRLNGRLIDEPSPLKEGDRLQVGEVKLLLGILERPRPRVFSG